MNLSIRSLIRKYAVDRQQRASQSLSQGQKSYRVWSFCLDDGPLYYGEVRAPYGAAAVDIASDPSNPAYLVRKRNDIPPYLRRAYPHILRALESLPKDRVIHIWIVDRPRPQHYPYNPSAQWRQQAYVPSNLRKTKLRK